MEFALLAQSQRTTTAKFSNVLWDACNARQTSRSVIPRPAAALEFAYEAVFSVIGVCQILSVDQFSP